MRNGNIDFQAVNQTALTQIESVLAQILPGGKREGHEYVVRNPTRPDDSPGSFKINLSTGAWSDFATGDSGGDPISLYAYVIGLSQADAARELMTSVGVRSWKTAQKKERTRREWTPVIPVPENAPPIPKAHPHYGPYSMHWTYRNADGALLGHICRFDRDGKDKEVIPLTYCVSDDGKKEWRWRSFDPPRPLYGLNRLAAKPEAPVLIVEGEKCADAAHGLLPGMAVASWPGGCKGTAKVDWTPLADRTVTLWPDNDDPGRSAMTDIAGRLAESAASVSLVTLPADLPKGWDVADAVADGWDTTRITAFIESGKAAPPPRPDVTEAASREYTDILDKAPFRCLGYDRGNYYYLPDRGHQVVELASNHHTSRNLVALAPLWWWWEHYPGDRSPAWQSAVDALFAKCYRAGIYDQNRLRGRGSWFDRGRVVLHHGDHLVVDGEKRPLNDLDSKYIYEAGPAAEFSGAAPIGKQQAHALMKAAEMLAWEKPVSAKLFAGWCMIAPISGALRWRPHILITGSAGTGKSTIMDSIVSPILGSAVLRVQANTTEAGIRQGLGNDAFPVVFDEAESENQHGQRRMDHVLELIRQASSETGAAILKGSQGGKAMAFRIRSCFCLGSIGVGLQQRSDLSRISVLGLTKHHPKDRQDILDELTELICGTFTPEWCAGMRARSIAMIPVLRENASTFARAVASQFDGNLRMGDQLGSLLAGAYALTSDSVINYLDAQKWVDAQDWSEQEVSETESDEDRCLQQILQQTLVVNQDARRLERSVVKLLLIAAEIPDPERKEWETEQTDITKTDAAATLAQNGIKVNTTNEIVVSSSHSSIRRIMQDTPWARGWHRILRRIEGATDIVACRFEAGIRTRAVGIPLAHVFGGDGTP